MKSLAIFLVMSLGISAQAADTKYSCSNVGGTQEWTVYVDLGKKLAGFFDNDTTVVVPFTKFRLLESVPPQMEYSFEGKDEYLGEGKLRIVFNKTAMTAYVVFIDKNGKSDSKDAEDGCVVDKNVDL